MKIKAIAISAMVLAGSFVSATAQEATPEPNRNVAERIAPICKMQDRVTLSAGAIAACNGEETAMPRLIRDGSRFSMRGVGAEFNTLLANVDNFK